MYKYEFSYKRLKKIWIRAIKNKIEICIEYNVITNKANINWINDTTTGHDNFINSLGIEEDKQVIKQAMDFAQGLKQYKEIINKYN